MAKKLEDIELHSGAIDLLRIYVSEYAASLLRQAKTIARNKKDGLVMPSHVEAAYQIFKSKKNESWLPEIAMVIGGAMFGTFIDGFANNLSSANTKSIITYTILGIFGLLLIFYGLWNKN